MGLPLVTKDSRRTVVCSADPAVTLKFQPQTPEEIEAKAERVREPRRPIRWLDVNDEVESVKPGALRVTYRPLDGDEQFDVTGGLAPMANQAALGRACQASTRIAITAIVCQGEVDAQTEGEVRKFITRIKMIHREPLGARILSESSGLDDPLPSSE